MGRGVEVVRPGLRGCKGRPCGRNRPAALGVMRPHPPAFARRTRRICTKGGLIGAIAPTPPHVLRGDRRRRGGDCAPSPTGGKLADVSTARVSLPGATRSAATVTAARQTVTGAVRRASSDSDDGGGGCVLLTAYDGPSDRLQWPLIASDPSDRLTASPARGATPSRAGKTDLGDQIGAPRSDGQAGG